MTSIHIESKSLQVVIMKVGEIIAGKSGALRDNSAHVMAANDNFNFYISTAKIDVLKKGDTIGLVVLNMDLNVSIVLFLTKEPDKENKILVGKYSRFRNFFDIHYGEWKEKNESISKNEKKVVLAES